MSGSICPNCGLDVVETADKLITNHDIVVNNCKECAESLKQLINHVPMIPAEPVDVA